MSTLTLEPIPLSPPAVSRPVLRTHTFQQPFTLESGRSLPEITITWAEYGPVGAPVVWVSHALTASADVAHWWPGLFGPGRVLNPERYRIICPNALGSCYGTTGPESLNLNNGQVYHRDFPQITVRDMARAQQVLADHLGIEEISLLIGGSLGGQQALEWAIERPRQIERLALLATNARHSAWGIAFNEAQRMAIEASGFSAAGLAAARATAMLSYRTYGQYVDTQSGDYSEGNARAAGYQRHQGLKLARRFSPYSYYALSQAMDTHNVARGRRSVEEALWLIDAETLIISLSTDILFPPREQALLARHIPRATHAWVDSPFGHDGFLTETVAINKIINKWLDVN